MMRREDIYTKLDEIMSEKRRFSNPRTESEAEYLLMLERLEKAYCEELRKALKRPEITISDGLANWTRYGKEFI